MTDRPQPEILHLAETNAETEAASRVDEIIITITNENASYHSSLPPQDIIFWIDLMKHMILTGIATGNMPEPDSNPVS